MTAVTRLELMLIEPQMDSSAVPERFAAMAETLGSKALQVAISRMEPASGRALATWSEIVERLGQRSPGLLLKVLQRRFLLACPESWYVLAPG